MVICVFFGSSTGRSAIDVCLFIELGSSCFFFWRLKSSASIGWLGSLLFVC